MISSQDIRKNVWLKFIDNILSNGSFLMQKFNPKLKHPSAAFNYEKYGISVKEPILIKAHMKARYHDSKYHYILVLIDKAKIERDSIREYYYACESSARIIAVM